MCAALSLLSLVLKSFKLIIRMMMMMMMVVVMVMEAIGLLKEFEHTLHIAHFGLERRVVFDQAHHFALDEVFLFFGEVLKIMNYLSL